MKISDNLELRSEYVKDILGTPPSWLLCTGTSILFVVLVILLSGSWFFKYPNILKSPVEIVTSKPIASIVASNTGIISALFVADSQRVVKEQYIAVIKNSANFKDVMRLEKLLPKYDTFVKNKEFSFQLPKILQLGEIQSDYTLLESTLHNYKHHIASNSYIEKIKAAKMRLQSLVAYRAVLYNKRQLRIEEKQLINNQFKRYEKMYAMGGISQVEYETGQQNLIDSRSNIEDIEAQIITNKIEIDNINYQIIELNNLFIERKEKLEVNIRQLLKNLESRVEWWFDNYMLASPIEGIIAFNKVWSKNQLAIKGSQIFTIIPEEISEIIGRVTLTAAGAGKVKTGQKVNVKLDSYPYREFGCVIAQVSSKTLVPIDGGYIVEIIFTKGLCTNYNKEIPFCQKMTGTAEIITENVRLLERFFNPLKAIWRNDISRI